MTMTGTLQIAFIVLKLIGKVSWPWWRVLIPTEIYLVSILLITIVKVGVETAERK